MTRTSDGSSITTTPSRKLPVFLTQARIMRAGAREEAWPADQVERWPIDRLIPYAKNSRTHSEAQIAQLAASMKEWGWTNPVLAGEAGGVRMIFCSCVIS